MNQPEITLYGTPWCPDCRRSKQFLGEHQIPYRWENIEQDKAGEQYVLQKNNGRRIIPTIEFGDGSILVEPSNAQLAARLNLKTTANRSHYDLIIVGGGPAGLTAGLYAAREGIDTLLFCVIAFYGTFSNQLLMTIILSNYIFKCGFEAVATPVTYKIVGFLKRSEQVDYYDIGTNFNPFAIAQLCEKTFQTTNNTNLHE